jgi:hypothetical protein
MLYVRDVHLTKAKRSPFIRETPIFSSEKMLHKDSARKGTVENNSGRESQGAWRQDELIGGKPAVVK